MVSSPQVRTDPYYRCESTPLSACRSNEMKIKVLCAMSALVFAVGVGAADFGSRGGPEPANIEDVANVLREDAYDMELLISYGTSKGGSAGHIALAIRD